jgi:hypothetical protein
VRNLDWPAIIFACLAISVALFSTDADAYWKGQGTWHPTSDYDEVVVMVNWIAANQLVPCGKHGKANGCAYPTSKSDIPRKGKLCVITHPKFNTSPSDEELAVVGELFDTCLTQAQSRIITVRWVPGDNVSARAYDEYVYAMPCGVSISFTSVMRTKGHEVLHCSRGHWHD